MKVLLSDSQIQRLNEVLCFDIKVGDKLLGGRFKNKLIVVKDIGKNDKGEVTINGKSLLRYRLLSEQQSVMKISAIDLDSYASKYCSGTNQIPKDLVDKSYIELSPKIEKYTTSFFGRVLSDFKSDPYFKMFERDIIGLEKTIKGDLSMGAKQSYYSYFGYSKPVDLSNLYKTIFNRIYGMIFGKISDNGLLKTAIQVAVTKKNLNKVLMGVTHILKTYCASIKFVMVQCIINLPKIHSNISPIINGGLQRCNKILVVKDENNTPLPVNKQYSPRVSFKVFPNIINELPGQSIQLVQPQIDNIVKFITSMA